MTCDRTRERRFRPSVILPH